jgi:hypothetical protein
VSWLRYSDDFTQWPEWDMATTDARWAYVCIVEAASRGKYWDGRVPKKKILAALVAQVDDPQQALERLAILSLIHEDRNAQVVTVPRIHDHIPPPGIRQNAEKSKVRMRRKRAHEAGDHSLCLEEHCSHLGSVTPLVTEGVTRNPGTGRDGTTRPRHREAEGTGS